MRDRLPTKENLASHEVLSLEVRSCIDGCEHVEGVNHLFLSCPYFGALWPLVRAWLGVGVESQFISDHFLQFINYAGGLRSRHSFFHLIWLLCVWVLWNERNDRVFRNKQSSLPHMLDKVKSYSFWWLKASNAAFSSGTHNWWSNPLLCMSIHWLFCILTRLCFFPWLLWHILCCNNYVFGVNIFYFCLLKFFWNV